MWQKYPYTIPQCLFGSMKLGAIDKTVGEDMDMVWVRYSGITVMSMEGVHDQLVEGSINGDKFEKLVSETLMPILNPFDSTNPRSIVIMDNCSVHHVDPVIHLIETVARAKVIFLPHTHLI